jgi:hypothetical protein
MYSAELVCQVERRVGNVLFFELFLPIHDFVGVGLFFCVA